MTNRLLKRQMYALLLAVFGGFFTISAFNDLIRGDLTEATIKSIIYFVVALLVTHIIHEN